MRATRGLVPVLLLAGLVLAPPAYAGDQLQVSADGVHWSDHLDAPLFNPAVRWVPGDVRVADFWVRSRAGDRGRLTLAVSTTDPDGLLARGDIGLAARADTGEWRDLDAGGRTELTGVPAGGDARVQVRARFAWTAANGSRQDRMPLSFRATLTEASAGDGTPGGSGVLPDTGSAIPGWLLPLAALASALGLVLWRRSDPDDEGAEHG
jgi:hypothetical protein